MILLGTDAGPRSSSRPGGGFTIHRALELLVEAGLTPYQALETGTRNFAQYLKVLDSAGTVAMGKRADLVLLKANPLVDVGNTRALAGVMVAGRWFSRQAAQAHIDTLRVGHNGTCRSRGRAVDPSCEAPPTPYERKWGSPDAQLRLLSRMIWR
jgi:adenine deaminase